MTQRVRTHIRYYAATDATPVGRAALDYLKGLLRIAPVRVLSVTGGLQGPWERFGTVLSTPIGPTFINVVCCDPARWTWIQKIDMPNVVDGKVVSTEHAEQRIELYTRGVRNVLLIASTEARVEQAASALRYDAVVAIDHLVAAKIGATLQLARVAYAMTHAAAKTPIVIRVPITDASGHEALRQAVAP